jgi:uncharacterized RDD family membrane protein YckC
MSEQINTSSADKYFGYKLASKQDRFFATVIETIALALPALVFTGDNGAIGEIIGFGGQILFSAILGAVFYKMWSGNLGHKIMGLKVISTVDGADQNIPLTGAIREGLKNIFGIVLIPVIWLLWDEDSQNLYDKVVKTYVVKKKDA